MNSNEIKAARIRQGISAKQLAEQLGVSEDSYYRRERREVKFTPAEIPILARSLHFTYEQLNDYIFDGELSVQ